MSPGQSEPLWIMEAPVISTAHLTPETMQHITANDDPYGMLRLLHPYGALLYIDATPPQELPEDLRACAEWAQDSGYEWLRFDNCGTTIDGLPTYEWE